MSIPPRPLTSVSQVCLFTSRIPVGEAKAISVGVPAAAPSSSSGVFETSRRAISQANAR